MHGLREGLIKRGLVGSTKMDVLNGERGGEESPGLARGVETKTKAD